MARTAVNFTTPAGRLVWGSVHKPRLQKDDRTNLPKKIKTGENAGQDLYMYQFGVAIPKSAGVDWRQEKGWGDLIAGEGVAAFPNGQTQRPDFSWKVTDGDSQVPNKRGKKPCEQEGYAGCWILSFSGISAPQIFSTLHGGAAKADATPGLINLGDFVQVNGSVAGNESANTPGVYLNHSIVCMRGIGPRIVAAAGGDTSGFGAGVAPGASAAPAPAPMPAPSTPPVPAPAAPPVPTPVTPDPAYSSATPAPKPQTASKGGNSWPLADLEKSGWTREKLLADGYTIA